MQNICVYIHIWALSVGSVIGFPWKGCPHPFMGPKKGKYISIDFLKKESEVVEVENGTDKIYNVDTSDYNSLVSYIQKNETKKAIDKFKKMLPEYKVDVKN